ncbi:hypothetical protein D3C80_1292650 [compost metagenome]
MAGAHADAELLVRTVDQVTRHAKGELERPQRVVRASRYHGREDIAVFGVFLADRGRWRPGGVRGLGGNLGIGDRRAPAFTTDTQRVGVHHVLPFRVVVHAVLGQVDDDAFARAWRQDETGRQDDLGAGARQPGVDARVGGDHFQVAQVVGRADIGKGVFVLGLDHLNLTNDIFARRWQGKLQRSNRTCRQQGGQGQATGDGGKARQHPGNPSLIQ